MSPGVVPTCSLVYRRYSMAPVEAASTHRSPSCVAALYRARYTSALTRQRSDSSPIVPSREEATTSRILRHHSVGGTTYSTSVFIRKNPNIVVFLIGPFNETLFRTSQADKIEVGCESDNWHVENWFQWCSNNTFPCVTLIWRQVRSSHGNGLVSYSITCCTCSAWLTILSGEAHTAAAHQW